MPEQGYDVLSRIERTSHERRAIERGLLQRFHWWKDKRKSFEMKTFKELTTQFRPYEPSTRGIPKEIPLNLYHGTYGIIYHSHIKKEGLIPRTSEYDVNFTRFSKLGVIYLTESLSDAKYWPLAVHGNAIKINDRYYDKTTLSIVVLSIEVNSLKKELLENDDNTDINGSPLVDSYHYKGIIKPSQFNVVFEGVPK